MDFRHRCNPVWASIGIIGVLLSPCANAAISLLQDQPVKADSVVHDIGEDDAHGHLTVTKTLAANEPFYLFARGTAISDTTGNMMLGLRINCNADYLWSTRNHEGSDAYSNPQGQLQEDVRFLFVPAKAGSYTCKLQGLNLPGAGASTSNQWTLLNGDSSTFLSWMSGVQGASWGNENDDSDYVLAEKAGRLGDADSGCIGGDNKAVDGDGNTTSYCKNSVHLGAGLPAGTTEYALRSARWTPAATVSSVKAIGDIELTVCYSGTGSCPKYAFGSADQKTLGSVVDTRLVVYQIPSGSSEPCATTYYPTTGYQRTNINSDAHHQKTYHQINQVPVSNASSCGSNSSFISKVEVKLISGNPVRIEGSHYSQNILMNN